MDADALLQQALATHQRGELDAAEALYREVLALRPAQPDALHFLGVLRHQQGHSDEAVDLIRAALGVAPRHAAAWNNLGNIHKECGRLAEAEACYRQALACAPDHADAWGNLALVLEAQGRPREAFATYGKFLEAVPQSARAHLLLGVFVREHAEGLAHIEQSVKLFRQAFALDDTLVSALCQQGASLYALQRVEEARQVYREWLRRDPDSAIAQHMLAACGGAAAPARASDAYVRAEFNGFAGSFDEQLLQHLNYHAPQVLVAALATRFDARATPPDVLDAGCGTGLCAPLLRPLAHRLTGVDLSPGMLAQARRRGGYDVLVEAELTRYLDQRPATYDAVISADTLVYFGDLAPVLGAAHAALRAEGWLAFSLEACAGDTFELSSSGRYRHGRDYVEATLANAGFVAVDIRADSLRREAGKPVASWVVLAQRAPACATPVGASP